MTAPNHQPRDYDDTTPPHDEGYNYTVPPVATIDRLVRWYGDRAAADSKLALSLDAQNLTTAADANRKRATAYRQTVICLQALRERHCQAETEFRGHLQAQPRPKARVRAPP